ncbi:MAG: arsenic metallochaperone ArsD family protein, partial [Bacillus sp. (in: Bacteria)]|nr:arsenic metallochaperone ArsD family protein [Bacillus sp. (in: firmicutes)]
MKKIQIFDPAMCCSSGVCGPSIDPDLLRVSFAVSNLYKKKYPIE